MEFYVIAYLYQEDVFYDFEKEADSFDMKSTCMLPTLHMAEDFIENELSSDYAPVKIKVNSFTERGSILSWSRDGIPSWDF